ncbi:Glycogen recognition site of AMP-activated protein kinase [Pseudarcicella hirudinis]|uniref:Glycogen recognition site of AMP-activated protein kinase n=1 Tax=Pseudarcicella hirudinis TaxID=1079859 RepID=A0A1I5YFS9_9BACT|nr:isoamylase early set domain-containing protein [Pseudarcicella hirudinis]SFQ43069.1 Glycogen recognition site of AMP-activated protein kinase [Pseudarcicella hirudinis]
MTLVKQFLKSKPVCKVTFAVPAEAVTGAKSVSLVGEFNDWNPETLPLKKQKDGSFKTVVELETGKEFQFRYLIDNDVWTNDSSADKYVPSGISVEENSVVVL